MTFYGKPQIKNISIWLGTMHWVIPHSSFTL